MSEDEYKGIPRSKIPWSPKIDYEKCISCGKCIDFCHVKAFGSIEENGKRKTIIRDKNACIVFCTGCEAICPKGAITHTPPEETHRVIEKLKKSQK